MIYLDNAATTRPSEGALARAQHYLTECYYNPSALYGGGAEAARLLGEARAFLLSRIADPARFSLTFTSCGTEADNWAVRGIAREGGILLSPVEHAAVLFAARRFRTDVRLCRVGEDGVISPDHVRELLSREGGVSVVGVMAVNNETGCVQPVKALAEAAHAAGAYFFSDCVQAACSCDLKEISACCDALSLSAHKAGGPKGVGALIVKKGVPAEPLIAGGEQERGLRGGTSNVAGIVGFAAALRLAQAERARFVRHTGSLRDAFEQRILCALGGDVRVDVFVTRLDDEATPGEEPPREIRLVAHDARGEALLAVL